MDLRVKEIFFYSEDGYIFHYIHKYKQTPGKHKE